MTSWNVDDGWQPRRRIRIRGPLTMVVLLGLLVGAAWFGYGTVMGEFEPEPVRVCNTPGPGGKQQVAASDITVNVYNAGEQYGLAGRVAEDLRERGFQVGEVANDPTSSDVDTFEIRARADNAPEVLVLRQHIGGKIEVTEDGRNSYAVDLVLGDKFDALGKAPKRVVTVESPLATCTTAVPTAG